MVVKCLICFKRIRLEGFGALLALREPRLCGACQAGLQAGSGAVIYKEGKGWTAVMERLARGALCLLELLMPLVCQRVVAHSKLVGGVRGAPQSAKLPYPWLEILGASVMAKVPQKKLRGSAFLELSVDNRGLVFEIINASFE
jgi:hypothetical protein